MIDHSTGAGAGKPGEFRTGADVRPHERLLTHYLIVAAFTLIGFPFVALAGYFRYRTLVYRFEDDGVTMRVGLFFKRETSLTYRRIQDIHVTRSIVQRWLGLATVSVQTASGAGTAELVVDGLMDYERVRDFLYERMRGAKGLDKAGSGVSSADHAAAGESDLGAQAMVLLEEIRDALKGQSGAGGSTHG